MVEVLNKFKGAITPEEYDKMSVKRIKRLLYIKDIELKQLEEAQKKEQEKFEREKARSRIYTGKK